MLDSMSESDIPFKGKTERRRRRGRRRMHSSLRGYVTIKRRPAGIYSRGGARIARLPDRSFMLLSRGTPTERRAILVLQTTPICWFVGHCFGTKLVHTWSAAVREETEGTAGGRWGEGDGVVCRRYRVKFSAEYKGPSRAWPKAGFTALLVNLAVCAYIFKTQLRSTRLEGIALSETILYLFSLRPSISPPLPALPSLPLPPSAGSFLFLFTRRGRSHAYPTDTMLLDVGEFLERTYPPPSLFLSLSLRRKECHLLPSPTPPQVFRPSRHLATTRPTRPN